MSQADPQNAAPTADVGRTKSTPRQLRLFPRPIPMAWQALQTQTLTFDEATYRILRDCYADVYHSYLPGPKVRPFFSQVADLARERGVSVTTQQLAELARRARRQGIEDFPEVRERSVSPSSAEAARLRTPSPPVSMSPEEHNAFANVYRDLLKEGYRRRDKGKGFFAEAETRMQREGFSFTSERLRLYASYRRRIGDVNFPRLRGSHELDRMHVAAVDRIQSLGVMATGLMHEILQPLQVILGEADLQKKHVVKGRVDPAEIERRMEQIAGQVQKLSRVVQHVRTIARAGEPKLAPVDLATALENALSLFLSQLRSKGITIDRKGLDAGLPPVRADAVAVERIFINLLLNARDAIEEIGRREGLIRITGHVEATTVICEVTDNGVGIAAQNRAQIFDPYFTTKEVGKGTGLGLTEVMNLMIQFGGRVSVESEPDRYTTFKLEFPQYAK